MTSMLTQYEQASQKNRTVKSNSINSEIHNTSGYIQMKLENEQPIFNKVKLSFNPSDKIKHVAVCKNYMVVAMANNKLFRIDLSDPEKNEEISLSKFSTTGRLAKMFLDPLGCHLLLSFVPYSQDNSPELVYLNRRSNKPKATVKFRGQEITQVGWNRSNESETSTGPILLGTSKGLMFETELVQEGDKFFQSGLEQYWRQVFDVGKGGLVPIVGLEFHRLPNTNRYYVLVATHNRLYAFVDAINPDEKPLLQQVFTRYLNVPEKCHTVAGRMDHSRLALLYDGETGSPRAFVWTTEPGYFYRQIDASLLSDFTTHMSKCEPNPYPKLTFEEEYSNLHRVPTALVLTEFHALMAFGNVVKGVSVLNNELVLEDTYNEQLGRVLDVLRDPGTGTVWTVTERAIFCYKIWREERNMWQVYCERGDFELAKRYSADNPAHHDQVMVREADTLYQKGEYCASALHYAQTRSSFEEVCLKFLQVDREDALKHFLARKLENLTPQDQTQITMIVVWMVELLLGGLASLRIEGRDEDGSGGGGSGVAALQKELDEFLGRPAVAQCIHKNKSTFYDLMASHGDKRNLIKLTIKNKDFEQVIRQQIYRNDYMEALDTLRNQSRRDLFYQFCPVLMQEIPRQTVDALVAQGRNLAPERLLPALVSCQGNQQHAAQTVRYLEHCVETLGCGQRAIHNLLLSLYADSGRSDKLMQYLARQGQDINMVAYDVHFALRLCRDRHLIEACVQLSSLLGLWETAVDLALQVNVKLAKDTANLPQNDDELRKKLWLKIAEHVISGKDDIEEAMEFLKQCDLIKIEDILSFFSDFVTIDHFKEAICSSLQQCNQHIQDIKEEMTEAVESAERVRADIKTFRDRYTLIKATDTCDVCDVILMLRAFYLFPCGHRFHSDCLTAQLSPNLGPAKRNKLKELSRELDQLDNPMRPDDISTNSASLSKRDQLKNDVDSIVASECLYCGEIMIRNIDKAFIDDNDYDKIMKEWE